MRTPSPNRATQAWKGLPAGRIAAVTVAVGLVLAGCGSRVPENESVAETQPAGVSSTIPGADTTGGLGTGAVDPGAATNAGTGAVTAPGAGAATGTAGTTGTGTTAGTGTGAAASSGTGAKTTGSKGSTGATAVAQGCKQQGPPVLIGQVGTFSGLVGANFAGAIKTSYVWVAWMNAHGGLGCHPIRFEQIDDQSNPALSQAAVEKLTKEGAVAIFAAYVPLDVAGFQAGLNKMKIAAIGGDQAAPEWNSSPYMFPVGGTARAGVAGSVQQAAEAGGKKIAVLYCVEASPCGSNFNDTIIKDGYAKKFGMDVVYSGSISITQPDYTAQCQNAKSAGADVVAWGLDRAGLQRAAKSCAAIGYFPKLPLIALQGSFDPKDPNLRKSGAFLSGLSFPYMLSNTPATKAYHDAMQQFAPTAAIDTAGSGTWAAGQMLAKIVENLGPSAQTRALTIQDIFDGAGKVKNETLDGLVPPTTYKSVGPQAENLCYFGIQFNANGTFTAPKGLKPTCI